MPKSPPSPSNQAEGWSRSRTAALAILAVIAAAILMLIISQASPSCTRHEAYVRGACVQTH